ncbi:crotonase/enoyl-CoA hydratase family protein [Streptomyces sp. NPDC048282]|uniref:crotonase/enoyl-CoA hydratase family protein n=1 Tax=Streptomyces sp. NPDC048282 TaxID=3365528 RepID=UPI00370FE965
MSDQPRHTTADVASQPVLTERRGRTLIITINRAHVRNAVDHATSEAIERAMDLLDASDDLVVGVLTGAGTSFCAGADLTAAAGGKAPAVGRHRGTFGVIDHPPGKPLIAAVEGYAVGGGLELCLACDLVVAAETARFGLPEVRHNLTARAGGLFRLPKRIPYHLAMEAALTGQLRDAAHYHRAGLVNRLVGEGDALTEALALAAMIEVNGPTAVAATKQIISASNSWATEEEAWTAQTQIEEIIDPRDTAEGLAAFVEKRAPVWTTTF